MPGQKQSSLRRLRKLVCDAGIHVVAGSNTWMAGVPTSLRSLHKADYYARP